MAATFHEATAGDVAALLDMMREFYALDGYPFDERAARSALMDLVGDPTLGRVWLARAGDEPIGYVVLTLGFSLEFHGRDAFVDELYVRLDHRGQGVGKRAIALVEATCRELGVRALHLEVERSNAAALQLYRTHAFIDHDRTLLTKWL
jgi:GNAT superfamily N-acetyltransferase